MEFVLPDGRVVADEDTDQPRSPLWVRSRAGVICVAVGTVYGDLESCQRLAVDLQRHGHVPAAEWVEPADWPAERARLALDDAPETGSMIRFHLVHGLPLGLAAGRVKPGLSGKHRANVMKRLRRVLRDGGWTSSADGDGGGPQ